MTYRDITQVNDWTCIRCDKPMDRVGSHCTSCIVELQEEIDRLEGEQIRSSMVNKPINTLAPWEFLNNEFQKIFGPRK